MVKFYSSTYSYDYPFSAVSLAYFLRYPNPYSRHVASTDTISRNFDPETQRLTTVRLHLKKNRMPPAVLKLLPKSATSGSIGEDGRTQSFILESSVIDVKEGWMETESRNLDWRNVLSVIEQHTYRRPAEAASPFDEKSKDAPTPTIAAQKAGERTDVDAHVILKSHIGEQIRKRRARWGEQASATSVTGGESVIDDEVGVKKGWLSTWSSGAMQRAIEAISLQRTERSQPKAQLGMYVVLDRLRDGGLQAVLEGMRKDREIEI